MDTRGLRVDCCRGAVRQTPADACGAAGRTALARWAGRGRPQWSCALALVAILSAPATARAQVFSTGQATVTLAGSVRRLPLFALPETIGSSGVRSDLDGRPLLGLDFGEMRRGAIEATVHFTVDRVHGPGRYGDAQIGALSVMYGGGGETWLYDPRLNACTCTLTKLDGSGVEGMISCASSPKNRPPFGTIRFEAAP